jgi:hypothetical protein
MQPNSSSLANGLPTAPHAHGAVANPGVRIGRNEYRGNAMAGRNQPAVQLQTLVLGIWTSRIKHAVPCTWSDRRNSSADSNAPTEYPKDSTMQLMAVTGLLVTGLSVANVWWALGVGKSSAGTGTAGGKGIADIIDRI